MTDLQELSLSQLKEYKQKLINSNRPFVREICRWVIQKGENYYSTQPGYSTYRNHIFDLHYSRGVIQVRIHEQPGQWLKLASTYDESTYVLPFRVKIHVKQGNKEYLVCEMIVHSLDNLSQDYFVTPEEIFIPGEWITALWLWMSELIKTEVETSNTINETARLKLLDEFAISTLI